jgi:DNA-directed RNA polymerase specialized sigma24 family protein
MTAKEYLLQAKNLKIRIETMREQVEFLRSAAEYSPPNYSDMPKSKTPNVRKNEESIIRLIEKNEQIETAEKTLSEIIEVINKIQDPTKQAVLTKRYLSGKSWGEISAEMFVGRTTLHTLHLDALAEIEILLK